MTPSEHEVEENERREMHLPYWERKEYRSYKHIKVLQPQIDTPIDEYIRIKIDEQEKRLISGSLQLKKNLKAVDTLPHNGIMSDMLKVPVKRVFARKNSDGHMTTAHFSEATKKYSNDYD